MIVKGENMDTLNAIDIINIVISCIIMVLFAYKIVWIVIGLFKTRKFPEAKENHTFAILIAGRNEENVIGQLIDSIKKLNYDQTKVKIFICADNCTDNTYNVCVNAGKKEGAKTYVFKRVDTVKVGKGYALDYLLDKIHSTLPNYTPDAFIVFDADNLLDVNYLREINKVYDAGYKICTSYRNSKNYDDNWISANTSMCFFRECRFMHAPRSAMNISTFVSGTGFMISSEILNYESGWKYTTMTEDIEFSASNIAKGNLCTFCDSAIFYDEQPKTMKASWNQRMRWQKGFYQCFAKYFKLLFKSLFSKHFMSNYEMMIMLFPFTVVTLTWTIFYLVYKTISLSIAGGSALYGLGLVALSIIPAYILLTLYGLLIQIREKDKTNIKWYKRLKYALTFPIFVATYIPISYVCLFKRSVKWKQIPHDCSKSIEEMGENKKLI